MAMPVKRRHVEPTHAVNVEAPRPRRSERLATRATPELKGLAEHAAALGKAAHSPTLSRRVSKSALNAQSASVRLPRSPRGMRTPLQRRSSIRQRRMHARKKPLRSSMPLWGIGKG